MMIKIFNRNKNNKTALETLQRMSGGAIQTVVNLINRLKEINDSIEEEKAANENKIHEIEITQQSLDELKNGNEKIISNFEGLLK